MEEENRFEKNDIEEIKDKKEKLSEKAMALAGKVYEEAAKANAPKEEETEETEIFNIGNSLKNLINLLLIFLQFFMSLGAISFNFTIYSLKL